MGVGAALCSLLINACENQLGYSKPLVLLHDGVSVNATCAVGVNGSAPASAPDQPFLLPGTRYCFDSKFRGVDAFGPLCIELANSCTDCSLYINQNGKKVSSFKQLALLSPVHMLQGSEKILQTFWRATLS